jgi:hypothetical protein
MRKTYHKPSIIALGLLRSITRQVMSGDDPHYSRCDVIHS